MHDGYSGAIEFGLYTFGQEAKTLRPSRWGAGAGLLFPSYFAHRTWPTGVGDLRICVAFDVKPSGTMAVERSWTEHAQ